MLSNSARPPNILQYSKNLEMTFTLKPVPRDIAGYTLQLNSSPKLLCPACLTTKKELKLGMKNSLIEYTFL